MLTEKEWDQFFELMNMIVNDDQPVDDKEDTVLYEAGKRGETANLDEFVNWFES